MSDNFFKILIVFIGFSFFLYLVHIIPSYGCIDYQISKEKKDFIDILLKREETLRKKYLEISDKNITLSASFYKKLEHEKKKFYDYCEKGERCEVFTRYSLNDLFPDRTYVIRIKYKFDQESRVFFNEIKQYEKIYKFDKESTESFIQKKQYKKIDKFEKLSDKFYHWELIEFERENTYLNCNKRRTFGGDDGFNKELIDAPYIHRKDLVEIDGSRMIYLSNIYIKKDKK